jgi:exodeoxyribonuclease III
VLADWKIAGAAPKALGMVSIATWNINSVRLRATQVARVLTEQAPDVLCLQEIKCIESLFPHALFEELGYTHRAVHGQKGYHGVATVSKIPFREFSRHDWQDNGEARHVGVELLGAGQGMILENVYIPAGGDIPDREINLKFGQKLDFLGRMTRWADKLDRPTLLVGDFNIAPLDCDVYDHKALLKVVSHTPLEVETLGALRDAHGWVDLGRQHIPAPERNYSWWSYRSYWRNKDQGRRLDHMWASPDLARQSVSHRFVEETRRWDQPSDHVPLITEFDL